ncbi:MAG: hypothetical protein ABI565_07740 [Vicinamibacteria bacterium]
MSLVLEALRRVEKPDARTGSIGAAVSSYRPNPERRGLVTPLLLGLAVGGAAVFLFGPAAGPGGSPEGRAPNDAALSGPSSTPTAKGGAGLPPPLIIEPIALPKTSLPALAATSRPPMEVRDPRPEPPQGVFRSTLVLQAISERDSLPIAVISDQLVKEGDKVGAIRVLKIGADSVEVQLENGKKDTVRFALPPPPESSPSPAPRP